MRVPLLSLLGLALAACPLPGQSTPAATAAEPSVAEVTAFLPKVDAMITDREERATRLVNEMKRYDQSIEAGIRKLRDQLVRATDSNESKTRVARLKEEFITGLENAARAYAGKRAELEESFRQSPDAYTRGDLFKSRGVLDDRINKRVEDIMVVASTFDAHKDLEKYIYHPGYGSFDDTWDGVWQDNPEFAQNRRASRAGEQAKGSVATDLDKAIDRLRTRLAGLKEQQRTGSATTDAQRDQLAAEIQRVDGLLQLRTAQRDSLVTAPAVTDTSPIGLKAAISLDKEIETTASDLRQDFTAMFQSFNNWKTVRAQLADCKLRRDRAAAWLEARQANVPK